MRISDWSSDVCSSDLGWLAVEQPVEDVEDMGLGRHASFQRQFDGTEHRLLIMLQDQREDLHHLPVTAGALEQEALQLPEGLGHLGKGRAVAQGARLALDHRQVMPPVIAGPPWLVMGPLDDPAMLA